MKNLMNNLEVGSKKTSLAKESNFGGIHINPSIILSNNNDIIAGHN